MRRQRRPYLASLVEDVGEAQRWRRHLVGELGTKMLEIQNRTCGTISWWLGLLSPVLDVPLFLSVPFEAARYLAGD